MTEFEEANLERTQALEEALSRAEAGSATPADWTLIRFECGLPTRPILETVERKAKWD